MRKNYEAFSDGPFTKDGGWAPAGGSELYFPSHMGEPLFSPDEPPINPELLDLAHWNIEARKSGMPPEEIAREMGRRMNILRDDTDTSGRDILVVGPNGSLTLRRADGTEVPYEPEPDDDLDD